MKYALIPMSFALLLAGQPALAKKYVEPGPGLPSATIHMTSSHTGSQSSNGFLLCTDDACEYNKGSFTIGNFSWARGKEGSVRIPAQTKTRIMAMYARVTGFGGTSEGVVARSGIPCINTIEFIPLDGHSYQLSQPIDIDAMAKGRMNVKANGREIRKMRNGIGCSILLLDSSTGKAPESLVVIPGQ